MYFIHTITIPILTFCYMTSRVYFEPSKLEINCIQCSNWQFVNTNGFSLLKRNNSSHHFLPRHNIIETTERS